MSKPTAGRLARTLAPRIVQGFFLLVFFSPAYFSATALGGVPPASPWLIGGFLAAAAVGTAGRDLAFVCDRRSARAVYRASMIVLVLSLNLFLLSLALSAAAGVFALLGRPLAPGLFSALLFGGASAATALGLANARRLRVRTVEFDARAFPPSWQGRRAVFFSDTHYGSLNGPDRAEKLVSRIMGLEPDIIFCGGDLFDGPGGDVAATVGALKGLSAPLGVWGVLGNHDYYYLTEPGSSRRLMARQRAEATMPDGPGSALRGIMEALGWRFLENQEADVDGVAVAGLKPFSKDDRARALEFLASRGTERPTILLNHKPDLVEEAAAAGVDLQLSGHTHGGPLFPMNVVMRRVLRGRHFGTGVHGTLVLDTSSGSGTSRWYPRTAGSHEVVLVTFGGSGS